MVDTVLEKGICEKCGAGVREDTSFCYNCGSSVSDAEKVAATPSGELKPEERSALDDLSDRLAETRENDDKLAKAAAQRKKARVTQRRTRELRWEPLDDSSWWITAIWALAIAVIAAAIVFVAVYWK